MNIILKNKKLINIMIIILSFIITFIAVLTGSKIKSGDDIAIGDISDKKYKATRNITDTVTTQKKKEEAYNTVLPVSSIDKTVEEGVREKLEEAIKELDKFRKDYAEYLKNKEAALNNPENENNEPEINNQSQEINPSPTSKPTNTSNIQDPSKDSSFYLSDSQIKNLLGMTSGDYLEFKELLRTTLDNLFERGVSEEDIKNGLQNLKMEIDNVFFDPYASRLAYEVLVKIMKPNVIIDREATEKARNEKMEKTEPVIVVKGQVIVDDGHQITEEKYKMLEELGFIRENFAENLWRIVGAIIIIAILFATVLFYIFYYQEKSLKTNKEKLLFFSIYNLCIVFTWALRDLPHIYLPILVFTLLVAMLIDIKIAVIFNICVAVLAYMIADLEYMNFIHYILAGIGIAVFSVYATERSKMISLCVINIVINCIIYFGLFLFFNKSFSDVIIKNLLELTLVSFFTIVIVIGSLPFWESAFGVVTTINLLDLTNPNGSLMRRLTTEAPGTYHHSIIVANLAEAAAIDVGANPILVRVGGYYHDIGKLKYPQYFSENQFGENPHDFMDPYDSAEVIKSHISYGLVLAEENKLPKVIKEMIRQHHGNTMIKYFYHKAKTSSPDTKVKEEDFRYPYEIPQSKETAIVMLADTVEAAVRSVMSSGKTLEEVKSLVKSLIKDKMNDSQLQDSMLTIKDLDTIAASFMQILKGMYHARIEYPKMDEEESEEKEECETKKDETEKESKDIVVLKNKEKVE